MQELSQEEEITKKYRQIRVTEITQKVDELKSEIKAKAQWYNYLGYRKLMDFMLQFPAYSANYDKEGWELAQPPIKDLLKQMILLLKEIQKYGYNFQDYIDYFRKALKYNI